MADLIIEVIEGQSLVVRGMEPCFRAPISSFTVSPNPKNRCIISRISRSVAAQKVWSTGYTLRSPTTPRTSPTFLVAAHALISSFPPPRPFFPDKYAGIAAVQRQSGVFEQNFI